MCNTAALLIIVVSSRGQHQTGTDSPLLTSITPLRARSRHINPRDRLLAARETRETRSPPPSSTESPQSDPYKISRPRSITGSGDHRRGCVGDGPASGLGDGVDKRGDRRGDSGRPKSGLEHSGPPRLRGRRRGLRRVGDSRPGRGDRGERLEKDAGLRAPARAPGTRRGESWQADRNNVWSLRTSGEVVRTTRGRSTVS